LNEAEASCGSSPVLELARQDQRAALDRGKETTEATRISDFRAVAPQTVWEHFAVGRSLFRAGKIEGAQTEFKRAIELEPNAFWPNFYLMLCAYRLEEFDRALNLAHACVALAPKSAECFYNRGLAQQALGHVEPALHDFNKALQLDPTLAVVYLHRGALLVEQRRFSEATDDLMAAAKNGANPADVHYQLALVYLGEQDRPAALENLQRALDSDPAHAQSLALKAKLQSP